MSAYLLDPEKLAQVAHIVTDHVDFEGDKIGHQKLCEILAIQNIRSIQARYEPGSYDETVKEWINGVETFIDYLKLTAVHYSKTPSGISERRTLLSSYQYQSCETDDWEKTLSFFVTKLALDNLGQDNKQVCKV